MNITGHCRTNTVNFGECRTYIYTYIHINIFHYLIILIFFILIYLYKRILIHYCTWEDKKYSVHYGLRSQILKCIPLPKWYIWLKFEFGMHIIGHVGLTLLFLVNVGTAFFFSLTWVEKEFLYIIVHGVKLLKDS